MRDLDLLRRLRDHVEPDEQERRRDEHADEPCQAAVEPGLQVRAVAADRHPGEQHDGHPHEEGDGDDLQEARRPDADVVHRGHEYRAADADQCPRGVHVIARHRPQETGVEVRHQVERGLRQRDGLERDHRHVPERDRPGRHERPPGAERAQHVVVLPARLRHRRDELGVGQADQDHHQAATGEREDRTERPRLLEPAADQHDPPEADHGAEPDGERVRATQHADEPVLRHVRSSPRRCGRSDHAPRKGGVKSAARVGRALSR